ncbi:preprotein translocase subunit YajC [Flavobacterium sp. F372]|uniref:Sec translocon accessory complex subunit YajC n=1 Tax=Flavobacterium bernardetii TaxID=2813823 RepID=A0ABR7IU58_9FLAO|nr:preprotein translocase subunit YajC [Flavobacterium bernardetii]MBC5833258.1 preprotein translocase subunit YajC [Flavobacterium bernardetii]NHF68490.1 preprotein translocase subunit YajC [Flavobacterium bernardetii]
MNPTLIIQLVLMLGVFYFLIIMPKNKKIKLEKTFLSNLKAGDKIITIAGIHGKVSEIAESTIVMETMSGKLKIEKSSISAEMSLKLNEKK